MDRHLIVTVILLSCATAALGCNGLDTSWHTHQGELHKDDKASTQIQPGEDAWRFLREAKEGEKLPGGAEAGPFDLLWEWRMELTNISEKSLEIKAVYYLVTLDKEIGITGSQDPPEKEKMAIIEPGERKLFTGKGFVDKKYIPRIAKGRGRFGIRPVQISPVGPRKETDK